MNVIVLLYLRSVNVRGKLIDLFSMQDGVHQHRSSSRTADCAVANKLHTAVVSDAGIIGRYFDRETRSRIIAGSNQLKINDQCCQ